MARSRKIWYCSKIDMQPAFQRLCGRLGSVVRQRQKETSLVKKAPWALYDGKNFDRPIKELAGLIDDLEKIYPVKAARQLVAVEIEEVDDSPTLMAISDTGAGIDRVLAEAAAEKAKEIAVRVFTGKTGSKEKARVPVGNEMAANIFGCGRREGGPGRERVRVRG